MTNINNDPSLNSKDKFSMAELRGSFNALIAEIKSKSFYIIAIGIICAVLGLVYSLVKKPVYTATATFVLEEGNKGGLLSQYAGLASLAGIDVSSGSSIFSGDNILQLYKSRLMLESALLTSTVIDGNKQLFIDRYITFNKIRDEWKKDGKLKDISFAGDPLKFNRKQDSLITDIVNTINAKILNIFKLDKKLNIICVQVATEDELFAKAFTIELVKKVNDFYVETKTKKSFQNVLILQHQADSIKNELNSSINRVASALDAIPNANPQLVSLRTTSQRRAIDVQANTAIYSEIVKNLEISKISLRQEAPLIQIIDTPVLPLPVSKVGKFKSIVVGFFLGVFVTLMFFAVKGLLRAL
jgi:uncharacterized protein involved in exopolysaccharide biosynthesis